MVSLKTTIAGLNFENPLILASGILGQTAQTMKKMFGSGFGGVVTKSIGKEPRSGHPNPTMLELETGLLNAMGLPNQGIESFENELDDLFSLITDKPVIGSIFGSDTAEFAELAGRMEDCGVHAVELNLSCPHAKGYGAAVGSDPETAGNMVLAVCDSVDIPVFAKLPPTDNISKIAVAVEGAGAEGIVAVNTLKAMAIDLKTRKPFLGNRVGGYSGPGIKPVGLRCVYEVYGAVDIPVIGCGGISNGVDALEYVTAGASALEIGSAVYYRGREAPRLITEEMYDIMEQQQIDNLEDLIGTAHD